MWWLALSHRTRNATEWMCRRQAHPRYQTLIERAMRTRGCGDGCQTLIERKTRTRGCGSWSILIERETRTRREREGVAQPPSTARREREGVERAGPTLINREMRTRGCGEGRPNPGREREVWRGQAQPWSTARREREGVERAGPTLIDRQPCKLH